MKKNDQKKFYVFQMKMFPLNIFSFILLIFMVVITYFINNDFFNSSINYVISTFNYFFPLIFLFLVIHEILHSLGYCIYGADFKKVLYGIQLEKGVFYCLCKQNINRKTVLNSLFFPLFYIGIVTYILGLIFYEPYLTWLSILNISGCSGDIIMFIFISRLNKDIEFTEMDDSTSFALISNYDVNKVNHFGLEYKGSFDDVKRSNYKKITISKMSYIVMALLLILFILLVINV